MPYVTGVIARVDATRRMLTYVIAGHPPGLLMRDQGQCSLAAGGPPMGLLPRAAYVEESMPLRRGDACAFVTDGITEAFDSNPQWWQHLAQATARVQPLSAETICQRIVAQAQHGLGPEGVDGWTDDRTVVVLAVHEEWRSA
jgi:sigma-B regulation protein RsbU (phosphoserine phosphatase)